MTTECGYPKRRKDKRSLVSSRKHTFKSPILLVTSTVRKQCAAISSTPQPCSVRHFPDLLFLGPHYQEAPVALDCRTLTSPAASASGSFSRSSTQHTRNARGDTLHLLFSNAVSKDQASGSDPDSWTQPLCCQHQTHMACGLLGTFLSSVASFHRLLALLVSQPLEFPRRPRCKLLLWKKTNVARAQGRIEKNISALFQHHYFFKDDDSI